ncbi:MAG: helix-turn-helix transcriptional regulator, partial [Candidatus Heimdallarchaeota archaeon]
IEDNTVKISWTSLNILPNYEYLYTIRFEEIGVTFSIPTPKSYSYIYIILAFLGGAAISTLVFFLIIKRKYQPEKSELVISLLSDSEQAVIKAINDEGGVAIQRRICERTGYSKSKISQILLKLEEKNVLKRERWGRTNKVSITNPSFLNIELKGDPDVQKNKDFDD